jgi:hypothetical protein
MPAIARASRTQNVPQYLPEVVTEVTDVSWLAFQESLAPVTEEIVLRIEEEITPLTLRKQLALWLV